MRHEAIRRRIARLEAGSKATSWANTAAAFMDSGDLPEHAGARRFMLKIERFAHAALRRSNVAPEDQGATLAKLGGFGAALAARAEDGRAEADHANE